MSLKAITTKAQLARELGYSRARMTQLAQVGMPVRPDGLLDRAEALAWIEKHTSSYGGGWHLRGKGGGGLPRLASKAREGDPFLGGAEALYSELRTRMIELPAILLRLGVPMPIAAASTDALDFIIAEWVLAYGDGSIDDELEMPHQDYEALAKVADVPLNVTDWEAERTAIVNRVVELFYPAIKLANKEEGKNVRSKETTSRPKLTGGTDGVGAGARSRSKGKAGGSRNRRARRG